MRSLSYFLEFSGHVRPQDRSKRLKYMINRVLIRTRVLQVAYAHLHRGELRLTTAEQDLLLSLHRTYDLYLFLLQFIPSFTEFYREVLDIRRKKHLATKSELSPNMRLVENRLADKLASSEKLSTWYQGFSLRWEEDETLLRHLLRRIESSEIYHSYLSGAETSFAQDRAFWIDIFTQIIATDDVLAEWLEQHSIYWQDDLREVEKAEVENRPGTEEEALVEAITEAQNSGAYQSIRLENGPVEVVKDFVEKTLRKSEEESSMDDDIRPAFKDEDDERFARLLFRQTLLKYSDQMKLIEPVLSAGWSSERLADVDALLLNLAVTEFLYFPLIPTQITINEYVELAKHYSTTHSASFVNGVLDALARKLKEDGKILK